MKTEIDQTLIGSSPTSVRVALHSAASYLRADSRLEKHAHTRFVLHMSLAHLLQHPWLDEMHLCCLSKVRLVA
jgi:hypothetical protein